MIIRDFRSCRALIGMSSHSGFSSPSRHNLRARTIEVRRLLCDEATPVNSTRTHSPTTPGLWGSCVPERARADLLKSWRRSYERAQAHGKSRSLRAQSFGVCAVNGRPAFT